MNPVIQSSTTPAYSGFATTQSVPKPSGLAVGDLWICYVHWLNTGQTITIPSGWTVLDSVVTDYAIHAIWRIATSGDVSGGTYSVTYSAKANAFNTSLRITGFDPVTPFGTASHASVSNVFAWTSPVSAIPLKGDSLVLLSYGDLGSFNPGMGNAGDTAFGNPEGTITNVQSFGGSTGGQNSGCVVYDNRTSASSTNGWVISPASNFADWAATIVAVSPLVGPDTGRMFFSFFSN